MRRSLHIVAAASLAAGLGSGAQAHTKLISANPAPNSTIGSAKSIQLGFSGKLMPKLTRVDLFMVGMGGRPHAPMKINGAQTSFTADGKTVLIKLAQPLAAGTYRINYQGLSVDTHKAQGSFTFNVK